jgi:hypothetical protein
VNTKPKSEGLRLARLMMVLSGLSPLFVLWAIRGSKILCDRYLWTLCAVIVIFPNLFLWLRILVVKKKQLNNEVVVGKAEDHRDHLLVYLFATLLPFYSIDTASWRDFAALMTAVVFVVFLFWYLNLHYLNILFAIRGYRVFTIAPPKDENPFSGRASLVLITPRVYLAAGERIIAYRLSNTLFFEAKPCQPSSTLKLQK